MVFDEVHFGSFASHYIRREYYFDVHPPLAKMLNGLAGWFVGFNGDFGFENIGDNYTVSNVSYGLRCVRGPSNVLLPRRERIKMGHFRL